MGARGKVIAAGLALLLVASLPSLALANEEGEVLGNSPDALELGSGGESGPLEGAGQQQMAPEGTGEGQPQDEEGFGASAGEGALASGGQAASPEDIQTSGASEAPQNADETPNAPVPDDAAGVPAGPAQDEANGLAPEVEEQQVASVEDVEEQLDEVRQGHWVVDARSGALERYWVWNDDGSTATNMTITPENGAGYYARAMSDGRILRGKWDSGAGRVYIADNNGELIGSDMTTDGWLVTSLYDGRLERYYVDATLKAACSGFFNVPNYGDVFGVGQRGCVYRGDFSFGGRQWSADNDGRLRSGWYVTSGFGSGLQRYWMGDTVYGSPHAAAVSRLVSMDHDHSDYDAYATANGSILRGRWDNGRGRVYIANNDGKLLGSGMHTSGWVVTSEYDGHLERYYVDADAKAACSGFFNVPGYGDVFGLGGTGRIHRGSMRFFDYVILADNDGRLPSADGWLVTNKYGQGTQRYWIEKVFSTFRGARPGYSASGYSHFTTDDGYVLRGRQRKNSGMIIANNDGLIAWHLGWLVTDQFDGHLERYYFDESVGGGMRGARVGKFTVDGKRYYGREDTGYVVRGVYVVSRYYGNSANAHGDVWHDDVVVIANDDGVLMSRAEFGKKVVQIARTQIGTSYTTDDNAYYPNIAFNCSGLTYWVYSQMGVHLPHNQGYYSYYYNQDNTANSQMWGVEKRGGWKTNIASLTPGDLVFFSPVGDKYRTGHVGIYIGDGKMIDCNTPEGTLVRSVQRASFVGGGFPITLI